MTDYNLLFNYFISGYKHTIVLIKKHLDNIRNIGYNFISKFT